MRFWAWLTTSAKGANIARIELMADDPILPDIAPFSYLIPLVFEIGIRDISWREMESWMRLTGVALTTWEMKIIKKLSNLYQVCAEQYNGSTVPSPYRDAEALSSPTLEADIKLGLRSK